MSDSNSDSSQQQTSEQQDNRIAAATGSASLVSSRSTVGGDVNLTVVSTDHDTVHQSFDFAKQISRDAADTSAASLSNMKSMSVQAIDAVKSAYNDSTARIERAHESVDEKLANAYTEAKAGEQKIMAGVGVAAVVMVALAAMKKGS